MAVNKVTFAGNTLIDLTADTLTSSDQLVTGAKAHTKSGASVTGTNPYEKTATDAAVSNALAALTEKGVSVSGSEGIADLAALIAAIEAGGGGKVMASKTITPSEDVICGDATSSQQQDNATYFEHGMDTTPNLLYLVAHNFDVSKTGKRYLQAALLYCRDISDVSTYDGYMALKTSSSATSITYRSSSKNGEYVLDDVFKSGSNHLFRATKEYAVAYARYGSNNTYLMAGVTYTFLVVNV